MATEEIITGAYEAQRRDEIAAGRAHIEERMLRAGHKKSDVHELHKRADAEIKADEERRHKLLTTPYFTDRAELDRAGAEVVDQAQTELEALGHLANRRHTIILGDHSNAVERMEHPDADPKGAQEATLDVVTAQAVNQPTVIAEQQGLPTIGRPLNNSAFADEELELDRFGITPEDRHVPKTREQAEEVARVKVPPTEQVVRPGWHQDQNTVEPVVVGTTTTDVLEENQRIAEDNEENRDAALKVVDKWPDELKSDGLVEDPEKPKRGWPKGKPRTK